MAALIKGERAGDEPAAAGVPLLRDVPVERIEALGRSVLSPGVSMAQRHRDLYTLRHIDDAENVVRVLRGVLADGSALLKHEVCYALGQMQSPAARGLLREVLLDRTQPTMPRHEAGEALGAIGLPDDLELLRQVRDDAAEVRELRETCELAIERVAFFARAAQASADHASPYLSIDPAPPATTTDVDALRTLLLDTAAPLFARFRCLFKLRDLSSVHGALPTPSPLEPIIAALDDDSALLAHEAAYVLGQIGNPSTIDALARVLADSSRHCMVRHECAEAIGGIGDERCLAILHAFLHDPTPEVSESCEVALDVYEAESTNTLYADGLIRAAAADEPATA